MEETGAFLAKPHMPAEPLTRRVNSDSSDNGYLSRIATATSQRNQATIPIIIFPLGLIVIGTCIGMIIWLALHGPALVPGQDTRITAIMISVGSRLAGLFIGTALVRSAWAAFLPHVLAGELIPTRALVGVCCNFMSLRQLEYYGPLPPSFKYHIILGALISLAMIGTSASFRYDSLGLTGRNIALVPDVASSCNQSLVTHSNYFCNGGTINTNLNANTTGSSWSYLEEVYTGGQRTVYRYGEPGDQELGANVTLGVLPAGWTLNEGNNLPWMEMWVTCDHLSISAEFSGSNYTAISKIYVNDKLMDALDIANMPEWGSVVHLYQRVNETGPSSSLSPWIVVMLARDLNDGTANMRGLAPDAVTYLGESYLDLHGYGPTPQGVLGAAAWCEFRGSTGGQWPDELWPPLNHTSNVVIGTVINDRPTMGTAMLNYGPSWQYNPVSENSLPGGSVSYIANNTGSGVSFPALFSSYIRNQWTLMAYSIAPQSSQQIPLSFVGSGSNKLHISLTIISVLPSSALVIGLLVTVRAWVCTIRQRHWVNRVEFESWWLAKALRPDMYSAGYCNATEKAFNNACESSVAYRDTRPYSDVGHLALCSTRSNGIPPGISLETNTRRVYG
jgi:hypothetical protein